jgi:murein DD-endopeptidase MepM/ murein hydrolase activator NlpD
LIDEFIHWRYGLSKKCPVFIVTYKNYLKSDYKPQTNWNPKDTRFARARIYIWGFTGFLVSFTVAMIYTMAPDPEFSNPYSNSVEIVSSVPAMPVVTSNEYTSNDLEPKPVLPVENTVQVETEIEEAPPWQAIRVARGDNLSVIFDRLKISPVVLYQVMTANQDNAALKYLLPGQELRFQIKDGKLLGLEYDQDLLTTLKINYENDSYTSELVKAQLRKTVKEAQATIDSSLFLAGQKVGLSDNLIMQLVAIYGWDIDFVLDIRKGDTFKLIYEEHFKDDIKVSEGPILAAEFINNKRSFKSVRFQLPDGNHDYFSDTGASMRKAFIRTPLNFSRISSKFSLSRRHPVLNSIRAHKGVDYAAPSGTPVKAAGDGTVTSIGSNGGYGRIMEIKHGGTYSTLYAHLSRFARGLKKGNRVKQGQIIAYVGRSGLATGPHLHYEFRVNGVHRNPLTVQLPKADSIPEELLEEFKDKTAPLLAQLESDQDGPIMVALKEEDSTEQIFIPENY